MDKKLTQNFMSKLYVYNGKDWEELGRNGKDFTPNLEELAINTINVLETFEGDARLDAKAIKNIEENIDTKKLDLSSLKIDAKKVTGLKDLLPKNPPYYGGGSGATFLKSMRDVDLKGIQNNYGLFWDASRQKFIAKEPSEADSEFDYIQFNTSYTSTGSEPTGSVYYDSGFVFNGDIFADNLSGTNTGDQDLSGYVPYTGATDDLDLGNNILHISNQNFNGGGNQIFTQISLDATPQAVGDGKAIDWSWSNTDSTTARIASNGVGSSADVLDFYTSAIGVLTKALTVSNAGSTFYQGLTVNGTFKTDTLQARTTFPGNLSFKDGFGTDLAVMGSGFATVYGNFEAQGSVSGRLFSTSTGYNGTASAPVFSFADDPDTGMYRSGANELSFATGGTQRVLISSGGGVGIGVSAIPDLSRDTKLYIEGSGASATGRTNFAIKNTSASGAASFQMINSSGETIAIQASGSSYATGAQGFIGTSNLDLVIGTNGGVSTGGSNDIIFRPGGWGSGQESVWFKPSGRVGIGDSNPDTAKLTINVNGGTNYSPTSSVFQMGIGVAANTSNISGMDFKNFNSLGQVRFMARNNQDDYLVMNMPGSSMTGAWFGKNRSQTAFLWLTAQTDTDKALAIGTLNAGDLVLGTNDTQRMMIGASTGNVGIGADASATSRFLISDSSTSGTRFDFANTSTGGVVWRLNSSGSSNTGGAGNFLFSQDGLGVAMMIQKTTGYVGIGTNSPAEKLHVSGGGVLLDNGYGFRIKNNSGTAIDLMNLNVNNDVQWGGGNSGVVKDIYANFSGNWVFRTGLGQTGIIIDSSEKTIKFGDNSGTWNGATFSGNQSFGGNVGIGTTNPTTALDVAGQVNVVSGTFPVLGFTRTTSETGGSFSAISGIASAMQLVTTSSGNMTDGFGGGIVFELADNTHTAGSAGVARIYARRDGEDSTGALQFWGGLNGNSLLMTLRASGNVGIGTDSPNANAILDLTSTTKAFMPPRMTTAQKNAISSPTAGMVVYDTTLNKLCVYTTAWETVTSI